MSRTISLDELLADEPLELRDAIAKRGRELVKAETLRRLRELAQKKQDEIAGLSQQSVSRIEGRNDILLSSLNTYVRGLGGRLRIVAELPSVGDVALEITREGRVRGVKGRPNAASGSGKKLKAG
jgi:hypothetical protein